MADFLNFPLDHRQALVATGVGAVTFPIVLGINQYGLKPLRISSGSPLLLASAAGGISVTLASLIASTAVLKSYSLSSKFIHNSLDEDIPANWQVDVTIQDVAASTLSGVVLFRALGGRFSSVIPSHLHAPGAFARQWIPAYSLNRANGTQKSIIQEIGSKYGCHTCGKRRIKQYFADHQPPNKLVKMGVAEAPGQPLGQVLNNNATNGLLQKFYPHCPRCSDMQGRSLAMDNKTSSIVIHPFTLRPYHFFFPIPILLLFLKPSVRHLKQDEVVPSVDIKQEKIPVIKEEPAIQIIQPKTKSVPNNLSELIANFPLFIVWQSLVTFLDSFSTVGSFHITLWAFSIIAALGTL